ncbi:MAG: hypothetical protein NT080_07115 [Spirochaetes bacterium]|nr:hypothetical protein [Spirochaetota bacterium]
MKGSIDGIGIEDPFWMERTATSAAWRSDRLTFLDDLKDEGKVVLVVDRVWNGLEGLTVGEFSAPCTDNGYIP